MSPRTIYLITGANRGIGLELTTLLLLRPHTTIIATTRSPTTSKTTLLSLPTAATSNLIVAHLTITSSLISSTPTTNAPELIHTLLTTHSITHIDTIIANAGISSFSPILSTSLQTLATTFATNTLLPIALFQAAYPLLAKSQNPRFVLNSSFLGSIAGMEENQSASLAYGVSKAAANYFVRKVAFEHKEIVAFAVHPGWAKTENGQNFADDVGAEEAPMSAMESAAAMLVQIDSATKATSGTFVSFNGNIVPW